MRLVQHPPETSAMAVEAQEPISVMVTNPSLEDLGVEDSAVGQLVQFLQSVVAMDLVDDQTASEPFWESGLEPMLEPMEM